jgi:hypothetical protein
MKNLVCRWIGRARFDPEHRLRGGADLRLCVAIVVFFPLFLAVGATSSSPDMFPPISGLSLADLRDTFEEVHNGHRHEAIDLLEPRGTPVHAVVSGTIRKLFLSKPGGNTIYEFDETGVYCYYYAHLDGYAEGLREGMRVERGDVIAWLKCERIQMQLLNREAPMAEKCKIRIPTNQPPPPLKRAPH